MKELNYSESNYRDHMANERTFLAWIRTSIGIIAFGFVLEKFALFIKQISLFVDKGTVVNVPSPHGYSAMAGIFLISFGIILSLFAYLRFKKAQQQIEERDWRQSSFLHLLLTIVIFTIGALLMVFLIQSSH